jgi:hypothetical protein
MKFNRIVRKLRAWERNGRRNLRRPRVKWNDRPNRNSDWMQQATELKIEK